MLRLNENVRKLMEMKEKMSKQKDELMKMLSKNVASSIKIEKIQSSIEQRRVQLRKKQAILASLIESTEELKAKLNQKQKPLAAAETTACSDKSAEFERIQSVKMRELRLIFSENVLQIEGIKTALFTDPFSTTMISRLCHLLLLLSHFSATKLPFPIRFKSNLTTVSDGTEE